MVSDTVRAKNGQLVKRNLHGQGFEAFLPMQKICLRQINAVCGYPAPTFDAKLQGTGYANTSKKFRLPPRTTTLIEPFQIFKKYYLDKP